MHTDTGGGELNQRLARQWVRVGQQEPTVMATKRYLITQRADGRWEGKREGFGRASILAFDREEVERRTRELASKNNMEVVVHPERSTPAPHENGPER